MSNQEKNSTKVNVREWITLSTVMIGAVLTILALIWQVPPPSGIVTATFLLMISFIFIVNSVSANSKAKFEAKLEGVSEKRVQRFVSYAEYSFGLGFTFIIMGFAILGYEYLIHYAGRTFLTILLPITFLVIAWILIFIYNIINYFGKPLSALRNLKRNLWIFLELICLGIIVMDFLGIISIP